MGSTTEQGDSPHSALGWTIATLWTKHCAKRAPGEGTEDDDEEADLEVSSGEEAMDTLGAVVLNLARSSETPLRKVKFLGVQRLKYLDPAAYPRSIQLLHAELVKRLSVDVIDDVQAEEIIDLVVELHEEVCQAEGYARRTWGLTRRLGHKDETAH